MIVFQGEPGANSDLACRKAYPRLRAAALPDLRGRVRGRAHRQGRARDDPDREFGRRPRRRHPSPDAANLGACTSSAEWFLPVHHQLMAPKGASLKTIKTVESHVHALGQCRNIIRELKVKAVVAADTAGSAREVSEAGDKTRAAIASALAAENLRPEDPQAQTSRTRRTTPRASSCWRASRNGPKPPASAQGRHHDFVFQVRNIPAALYKALGGFATNGVNMTKLESYMVGGSFSRRSSMPTSRAIRRIARSSSRWRSWSSSRSRHD